MKSIDSPLIVIAMLLVLTACTPFSNDPGSSQKVKNFRKLDGARPDSMTPLQRQAAVLQLIKSISGINHVATGET